MAKPGRPSSYREEFAEQAAKLCRLGATDVELADFFGVDVATVYRWRHKHPEFCEALKAGKETADERVAQSLYHRAIGYTHDAVKIFNANGTPLVVPYQEHVPPDTTACIFWLKNRRPEEWRDKVQTEVTGQDGGPVKVETSDTDAARAIAFLLAKASRD